MLWIPLLLLISCQYKAPARDSAGDDSLRGDAGVFPDAEDTGWGDSGTPGADTAAGETGEPDGDGDGYPAGRDCDDGDPDTHPGAEELCDGVDSDCDEVIDEGAADAADWYIDADGDGFGDPEVVLTACEAPAGYTDDHSDCDDDPVSGWAVNPAAPEVCDGVDNNCDMVTDGAGAEDAGTWYVDDDRDGYGDGSAYIRQCEQPAGYSAEAGDCDDAEPATYPGAGESCDTRDNDCDSAVDEDAADAPTWYRDYDLDGYGDPDFAARACEPVTGFVEASDDTYDCDDTRHSVYPGASESCNARDDDCDGLIDEAASDASTWYADQDRDGYGDPSDALEACLQPAGYIAAGDTADCDDSNSTVYPGAIEFCDLEDDDCDGGVDEGSPGLGIWYADGDEDGWGDASDTLESCSQPEGYVATAGDCDTAEGTVHPGADELCDEVDQDCDGAVDEGASDAPSWYIDFDGDTWGSAASTTAACSQPDGFVERDGDCRDIDGDTYPGADELCDGVDQDCDEAIDEGAVDASTWYGDGDGDGWGADGDAVTACERPDGYRAAGGDCDDDDPAVSPGAYEICDALDQDCDEAIDEGGGTCPCDVQSEGGHPYLFCDIGVSWASAQSSCSAVGYHLVTLDDEDESLWLDSVLETYAGSEWWMGYTDQGSEGDWYWEDGSDSSFTRWHDGEPNNAGNEDCGELRRWDDETWNDSDCGESNHFVCESG